MATQQFDLLKKSAVTQIQTDLENATEADRIAAEAAKNAAETSETNAATSEQNAENSEQLSEKWAENPEDVTVEAGKFSALNWALKAEKALIGTPSVDALSYQLRKKYIADNYSVISQDCLYQAAQTFFDDFPNLLTALFPAEKIGSLGFSNYDQDDQLRPVYQSILPATFTRPNSPEDPTKSGATVINADGTIRELAEDEAPWSYPEGGGVNGCASLVFAPQTKNRVLNPESQPTAEGSAPPTITDAGFFGDIKLWKIDFPDVSGTLSYIEFSLDAIITGDFTASAFINAPQGEDFLLGFGINTTNSETFNGTGSLKKFSTNQSASSDSHIRVTRRGSYTNTPPVTIYMAAPQVEDTGIATPYIPGNITRNNSSIIRSNAITDGIFGTTSGSIFIELDKGQFFGGFTSSQEFLTFGTAANSDYIRIRGSESNPFVQIVGFGISDVKLFPNTSKKLLITWDKKVIKIFSEGIKQGETTASTNVNISDIGRRSQAVQSIKGLHYIKQGGVNFAPFAIPETTAAALTA